MDLFPPDRLPLVPESTLRKHKVYQECDSRFRACARLLQALYREEAGMPMGGYVNPKGKHRKLGSRLATLPAMTGANFLAAEVFALTRRELIYREPGAAIDENRVWSNMLSSMPLTFNIFGPLKLRPALAERFIQAVLPDCAGKVAHIAFEHSPGRGDMAFLGDGTAFDAFITVRREDGTKTFIAIEVKYAEGLTEPEARHRPRYDDLSVTSGLFRDPDAPELRRNPLGQLWREHMLAQALVTNNLYDAGAFVLLAPRLNNDVQRGAITYATHLTDAPGTVRFINLTLEDAAAGIAAAGDGPYARAFTRRYTDFAPVHAAV